MTSMLSRRLSSMASCGQTWSRGIAANGGARVDAASSPSKASQRARHVEGRRRRPVIIARTSMRRLPAVAAASTMCAAALDRRPRAGRPSTIENVTGSSSWYSRPLGKPLAAAEGARHHERRRARSTSSRATSRRGRRGVEDLDLERAARSRAARTRPRSSAACGVRTGQPQPARAARVDRDRRPARARARATASSSSTARGAAGGPAGSGVADRLQRDASRRTARPARRRAARSWPSRWQRFSDAAGDDRRHAVGRDVAQPRQRRTPRGRSLAHGAARRPAARAARSAPPTGAESKRQRARVVAALVGRDVGRVAVGAPGARVEADASAGSCATSAGVARRRRRRGPPRRGRGVSGCSAASRRPARLRDPAAGALQSSSTRARTGSCIQARSIGSSMIPVSSPLR